VLRPLTDETIDHVIVGGRSVERLARALLDGPPELTADNTDREVESVAAFVALETVLPRNLDVLPVERILEFRAKHLAGRGAFQTYLSEPKLDDFRGKLAGSYIDTVTSVLSIQVGTPWLVAHAATLAGVAANPVFGIGAGAALAFAKVARDRRKSRRDVLKSSPESYLLRAEENLAPRTVLGIRERAHRLFGREAE
jgi:hypothetical protein